MVAPVGRWRHTGQFLEPASEIGGIAQAALPRDADELSSPCCSRLCASCSLIFSHVVDQGAAGFPVEEPAEFDPAVQARLVRQAPWSTDPGRQNARR